jgi:photosystem II stability/assembly factor-like uncharacterized protein
LRTRNHVLGAVLIVIASCGLSVSLGQEKKGGPPKRLRVAEPPDIAERRAKAFHDIYAGDAEIGALTDAIKEYKRARESRGPVRPARPLPINFPSRDRSLRLRVLTEGQPTRTFPGSTFRNLTTRAPVSGTNWENLGPTNFAGRVSSLAVDPTNDSVIYRGTAGGGLWKSTDGGTTWTPLTDSLGNLSIGAVAVAPSQPQTIYVGTGEGALGIDGIDGVGFIKSTDGGSTWTLPTSVTSSKFFALSVHPTKPDELLAATEDGIAKSTDGGATWTTKFSQFAGTELVRIPGSPSKILATTWDISSATATWKGFIFRSLDGGETWNKIGGAGVAPFNADAGRMSLAVASSAPSTVYVLAGAASGDVKNCPQDPVDQVGFYRSTDGGDHWTFRSNPINGTCPTPQNQAGFDSILAGQGWYANSLRVSKTDPNTLYAGGLDLWKSSDGAGHWTKKSHWDLDPGNSHYVHADIHALVWAGTRLLIGDDGGMSKTTAGAAAFTGMNSGVVTRQYYSIGVSAVNRDLVIGGAQDNGTNIRIGATTEYREVIGGDGFAVAVHSANPQILYGTVYTSRIFRSTDGGQTFDEITPNFGMSENRPFISPLTMDPGNPSVLYTGSNFLWKTSDGGTSWNKVSSQDLGDGSDRGYVTKIAVAKSNPKRILTATGSGTVRISSDGGSTWTALQGLPHRYAAHVEFDPTNNDTFYVSFTTTAPSGRLFKTTNGGSSFSPIDTGLPQVPVHVLRVDPGDAKTLYAGTDVGLYRSSDGGTTWARFGTGLPAVSIWDIAILPDGSMMRIATHGRGFFQLKVP